MKEDIQKYLKYQKRKVVDSINECAFRLLQVSKVSGKRVVQSRHRNSKS